MPIFACGINHKTAPIALREKVIFAPEKLALYLEDLIAQENITDAVLLSTCNRTEFYCASDELTSVVSWFCRQHSVSEASLKEAMYHYKDQAAIEHIMKVACGVDSMILGESQILGQMKAAFTESCAAGAIGPTFNRLFQQVFAVSKEIRVNTAIGACPVSVSSAAVNFIKARYPGELSQARLLILGAGVTAELIVRHLKSDSLYPPVILNRSFTNAQRLAKKYACHAEPFESLSTVLKTADIVISATGSPIPLITRQHIGVREKACYIIDIAVPRDVELSVAHCANVNLYSIDDLKESIQQNTRGREHAAEKAIEMIKQKSEAFVIWLNSLDMVSFTIRQYRKQIEELCRAELTKADKQLQKGEDPNQVLTHFAQALTNKLLHTPSVQLRQAGFEGRTDILQWAQQLFAISDVNLT